MEDDLFTRAAEIVSAAGFHSSAEFFSNIGK
jgi:hypothetical protein